MSKINLLDDIAIGKIAAGEVIERPASVVKELVENSIDAGADSIEVEISDAGSTFIRVADNGEGMSAEDAEKACLRHATSKIKGADDLEKVKTLGFRGEGLSSIAAVSQLDIISYNGSGEAGIYLYLEDGKVVRNRPAGRSQGTTIEVRNLFYNVPARKKFLRKGSTELTEIINVMGRFILSHPGIEFKLKHSDRTLLYSSKDLDILERINIVLGGDVAGSMIDVGGSAGGRSFKGYVSAPSLTRKDKSAQIFFVNNRYVRSKVLSDALYGAYKSMLERGRHPAAVLFVDTPAETIDVNVHPTKLLVKFENDGEVRDSLSYVIKEKFSKLVFEGISPEEENIPEYDAALKKPVNTGVLEEQDEFDITSGVEKNVLPRREPLAETRRSAKDITDIYQVGNCYIVRPMKDAINVLDQHAAHERVMFEMFSKAAEKCPVETQNLLFPVRLELSASNSLVMDKVISEFAVLGFEIENFGQRSYVVQSVPAVLKDSNISEMIFDILSDMASIDLKKTDILDEMIKMASCRSAIKSGKPLTKGEMISLIEQLEECDLPFTCPHGRPTVLDVTVDELEKRFRRK